MRILVYPHDLNMGGSQTNAIELAAAVTALGHECIIFGRRGTLCGRIEELGLDFIESPDPGRRPSLRIARRLREITRERGIDIIHGYEWPPGLEAAMAAERLPDVAAVCTVMSMAVAPFLPRSMPLVVGTQQIAAAEQRAGRLEVALIEPPVDLEHNQAPSADGLFEFRRRWGLDDRPTVVIVSRLVPELKAEGIFTAIEVAGNLAATHPFQLLIVGDGKARESMESAADAVNARVGAGTVVFTGQLDDPRAAYAVADIAIGMGGSALRSLAFGKPLVVQGELGFFRTLTPETLADFQWRGWYGVGDDVADGAGALARQLEPLLADAQRRRDLGEYSRRVVNDFSLETAAARQLAIYREAWATRSSQKRRILDGVRSFAGLARYHITQRLARFRGTQRADDFNADPVTTIRPTVDSPVLEGSRRGTILYFPGVGWDTMAGTDRQLVAQLADDFDVVWVDTPYAPIRRRDRGIPSVSQPLPHVTRLRAMTLPGVQRPILRGVANRRRAAVAYRHLAARGLEPAAVIVSSTAPMLYLTRRMPGLKVYFATDDFVQASQFWGVSKSYLGASREANLKAAHRVLAVTPELARHLQRTELAPGWLPNGADVLRFQVDADSAASDIDLPAPIAGVVGQFNSRIDLNLLGAVQKAGISLLLVGPRSFATAAEEDAFDALVNLPGVQWVDRVPRDALAGYYRAMHVGLTPYADTMFNRRSYPLKTLEYLSAGLPVVATDVVTAEGLDSRFVHIARGRADFIDAVRDAVSETWDRAIIRTSAEGHGWDSRARRLITMLREDPRR
ncbi:glycosyltransferase [uncultured Microbacterium sp.]|uniref:glycosyltransferase n=1 Tax=uncultured Microbacterium sp. TaxID=191216 RepID=UPI0035CC7FE1